MKRFLIPWFFTIAVAQAQVTAIWDGGTSTWDDSTHWSTNPNFPNNGTPEGTTYNAVINAGEVTHSTATAIERLTLSGGRLAFGGGDPLTVAAGFDWSGGELYAEAFSDPCLIVGGNGSTSSWSGSLSMQRSVVQNSGALTLANGIEVRVNAAEFAANAGLRNLPGGTVTLAGSGSWLGQWFGEGPEPEGLNNQGTLVKNGTGTFTVGLDSDGSMATPFQNSGTVIVNGGTLQLDAPVTQSSVGTWTVNAGGTLVFNEQTYLAQGNVLQGAGDVVFAYGGGSWVEAAIPLTGTVTLRGPTSFSSTNPMSLAHLVIDDGFLSVLSGSSAVTITGNLTWLGKVSGVTGDPPVTLAAGATGTGRGDGTFRLESRTFSNAGSFTWSGGTTVDSATFDIYAGGHFRNEASGTFTAAGNGNGTVTFSGNKTGTFTNEGIFEKSGAGTLTRLNWEFANTGLVRALGGRLEINKLISSGGSFESLNGAELYLRSKDFHGVPVANFGGNYMVKPGGLLEFGLGKIVATASFPEGAGTVSLAGAEVERDDLPADLVRFTSTNSKVNPPSNVLTLQNVLITDNGIIGLGSSKRVRITGSLDWQSGGIGLPPNFLGGTGGTLELAVGSTTTLSGVGTVTSTTLQNAGTFTAAMGSTLKVNLGTVQNTGTMDFGDGSVLELRPSTTNPIDATLTGGTFTTTGSGVIQVFTGRTIIGAESYASLSGATVNGTIELVANRSRLRLINGGDVKGVVRYTATASPGAGNFTSVDIQQNATLSGVRFEDTSAAQASKSVLAIIGSHTVTLGPTTECVNVRSILGDYFDATTNQIIDTGSSTIINEGTIRVDGADRSTSFRAIDTFENRGILRAENGATIFADREFTQTAGSILLAGGNFIMTTPDYRPSTRTVTVSGGSLGGNGTFEGHLVFDGGNIAPGNSPGTLTVTGNLTLGGGTTLSLEFDSLSLADKIVVNGAVTLTGDVELSLSFGYSPAIGDMFTIIDNDGNDPVETFGGLGLFTFGGNPLSEGATFMAAGAEWTISYIGGTGNDVTLSVIPEPSISILMITGLAVMLRRRRVKA